MQHYTRQTGLPADFHAPFGTFKLRYSDAALETAKLLGLDMSYLPLALDTSRAELIEIMRDGDTTERLYYQVRMGDRDVVLAISPLHRNWRVTAFLERDG
jgi:hypothetical protein